jgi:hypothetical protein
MGPFYKTYFYKYQDIAFDPKNFPLLESFQQLALEVKANNAKMFQLVEM